MLQVYSNIMPPHISVGEENENIQTSSTIISQSAEFKRLVNRTLPRSATKADSLYQYYAEHCPLSLSLFYKHDDSEAGN
jgi:hypothetical protein